MTIFQTYDYHSIYISTMIYFEYDFYYMYSTVYLKPLIQYCFKKSYLKKKYRGHPHLIPPLRIVTIRPVKNVQKPGMVTVVRADLWEKEET